MGHAYTPGLKVKERLLVKKQRILPLKGNVLRKVGDKVQPDDVVARTELPGNVVPINVANKLGIPPEDIDMVMLKKVGDPIKAGELIALSKTLFIFKNPCHATIDGTIESISSITGQVLQRGAPSPVEVKAYLQGEITQVHPSEGVEVQCMASFVQGIFGIGGEKNGPIHIAVKDATVVLEDTLIDSSMTGKVIARDRCSAPQGDFAQRARHRRRRFRRQRPA
jgi:biotin carboxyl carrier protein